MATPADDIKGLRSTKRYAKRRLPELREEIKGLAKQRSDLMGEVKNQLQSGQADEAKAARSKAGYLRRRLRLLR